MIGSNNVDYEQEWEKVQVSNILFNFPFNTSLAGFSMLTEAIMIALNINKKSVNMAKDVYSEIAKQRNINGNSVEKGIKSVIDSVYTSTIAIKDIICPNIIIKNALIDGRPKHFIMAIREVVKLTKQKFIK